MNLRTLTYDIRQLRGDPMLMVSMALPFLLWALMKYGFPPLAGLITDLLSYDILQWFRHAGYFFMLLIPLMTGMAYGFILVDERDGGIITAISVTPTGKQGYLLMRMGLPLVISFLLVILFQLALDITGSLGILQVLSLSVLIASQALMILLFLGAFAANKVVGMAIAKGFAVLLVGPLLDYILPGRLHWIGAYSPMFWTGRAFLADHAGAFWFYLAISLAVHGALILVLYRRFLKRSD
jgi:fluoroquinolone transport system permease protein